MGCDIIMHSQAKVHGKWQWYDYNIFDDRSYTLYGILSGTRGTEFDPIAEMKGFPEDSEDKLKDPQPGDYEYYTVNGIYLGYAGVSYLSLTELMTFDWGQKIPGEDYTMLDCNFCKEVLPYLQALADKVGGPDNVRIVFGYSV